MVVPHVLSWARPYDKIPEALAAEAALVETEDYWENWTT